MTIHNFFGMKCLVSTEMPIISARNDNTKRANTEISTAHRQKSLSRVSHDHMANTPQAANRKQLRRIRRNAWATASRAWRSPRPLLNVWGTGSRSMPGTWSASTEVSNARRSSDLIFSSCVGCALSLAIHCRVNRARNRQNFRPRFPTGPQSRLKATRRHEWRPHIDYRATTSKGRIISLSSCSRTWQCHTYFPV